MNFAKFLSDPWRTSHSKYHESALAAPAPEYANSEVLLSSLYRAVGFSGLTESAVPKQGKDLDREVQKYRNRRRARANAALDADSFHMMLHSTLESPKLPNQSAARFLQITPLVPQAAAVSGAPRNTGSPWSPGALIRRMIWLGATDKNDAGQIWSKLFESLSVSSDDDIFARFLQQEISAWVPQPSWKQAECPSISRLEEADSVDLEYPARQFVEDLRAVIDAKSILTRRQWTSLLESILRIATVSHILWICEIHDRTWKCIRESIAGDGPTTIDSTREALFPRNFRVLSYGDRVLSTVDDHTSAFLTARLGINATLWAMLDSGQAIDGDLASSRGLLALCNSVRKSREALSKIDIPKHLEELLERENRTVTCQRGIGRNIREFVRHVLGQRQAANAVLRGYDQGYAMRKRGTSKSGVWVVGLGPVAVIALVYCALSKTSGPRSVRRLAQHLAAYGIAVDHRDIAYNDLGHQLRMLGLVLDSPDAESGMLLVPPFTKATV
jgi:hypothetical protein